MSCPRIQRIQDEFDEGLGDDTRAHILECKECALFFEELRAAGRALEDFGEALRLQAQLWSAEGAERARRAAARRAARRTAAKAFLAAAAVVAVSLVLRAFIVTRAPEAPSAARSIADRHSAAREQPKVIHVPIIVPEGAVPRTIPLAPAGREDEPLAL
jgi:hypothetical protein